MLLDGSLGGLAGSRRYLQMILDADAGDTNHAVDIFDVAFDFTPNSIGDGRDLTHCQCAGKSAGQSTAHRRDHVIERRGQIALGLDFVKVFDAPMHAEGDGGLKVFDVSAAIICEV